MTYELLGTYIHARSSLYERSWISPERAEKWLGTLAHTLKKAETEGPLSREIVLHDWWKILGKSKVSRTYSWFLWLIVHLPWISFTFMGTENDRPPGAGVDWFGLLTIFVNYLTITYVVFLRSVEQIPRRIVLGRLRSPRNVMLAFAGLVVSSGFGYFSAHSVSIEYGVAWGLGLYALVVLALTSSGYRPTSESQPSAPLASDRRYTLLSSLILALLAGFYYNDLLDSPQYGIFFALLFFFGWMASSASALYLVSVYYGYSRYDLPWRFGAFLEWARSAGLLRASGQGYQFRHQQLQTFLEMSPRN